MMKQFIPIIIGILAYVGISVYNNLQKTQPSVDIVDTAVTLVADPVTIDTESGLKFPPVTVPPLVDVVESFMPVPPLMPSEPVIVEDYVFSSDIFQDLRTKTPEPSYDPIPVSKQVYSKPQQPEPNKQGPFKKFFQKKREGKLFCPT